MNITNINITDTCCSHKWHSTKFGPQKQARKAANKIQKTTTDKTMIIQTIGDNSMS